MRRLSFFLGAWIRFGQCFSKRAWVKGKRLRRCGGTQLRTSCPKEVTPKRVDEGCLHTGSRAFHMRRRASSALNAIHGSWGICGSQHLKHQMDKNPKPKIQNPGPRQKGHIRSRRKIQCRSQLLFQHVFLRAPCLSPKKPCVCRSCGRNLSRCCSSIRAESVELYCFGFWVVNQLGRTGASGWKEEPWQTRPPRSSSRRALRQAQGPGLRPAAPAVTWDSAL